MVYRHLPASQARIACGVVLRAANQNRSIASGNRTIKISPQAEIRTESKQILQIEAMAFAEGFQLFGKIPAGTAKRNGVLHLRENLQLGKAALNLIHGYVVT